MLMAQTHNDFNLLQSSHTQGADDIILTRGQWIFCLVTLLSNPGVTTTIQQQQPPQQIETEPIVAASTTNTKSVLEPNIHHVLDIRFVSGANIQLFSDQL